MISFLFVEYNVGHDTVYEACPQNTVKQLHYMHVQYRIEVALNFRWS